MKFKSALSSLTLLLALTPAHAVTVQTPIGGSGSGLMRTGEMMDSGEFAFTLSAIAAEYSSNGVTTTTNPLIATAQPTFSYGVGGWGEINLTVPYQYVSAGGGTSETGMGDSQLILKFGGGRKNADDFAAALSLYGTVANGDDTMVTGDGSSGIELNLSSWYGTSAIHFNLGYETSDSFDTTDGLVNSDKYTVALGLDTAVSEATTLFFQSNAFSDADTNDNNMLLTMGVQFLTSDSLALQAGYSQAFPRDRSEPQSLLFANLTYAPGARRKTNYFKSGGGGGQQPILLVSQEKKQFTQEELSSTLAELEDTLVNTSGTAVLRLPLGSAPRTEVLDASSNPKVSEHVMEQLKKDGVTLVNVRKQDDLKRDRTWIYYNEGFSREAVTIGRTLKGSQVIIQRALPKGIDIQVVIGEETGAFGGGAR